MPSRWPPAAEEFRYSAACNKKTYPGFIGIATSVPQRVVERRPGNPTKETAAAKGRSSIKPPKYGRKQG